jgi:hypothetical protein
MNKRLHYAELIKKLLSCENRVQLSDVVKEINEFNRNYFISQNSEEFKKFETVIGLMKIKLRHKHGITESKNYLISENQLKLIVENNRMDTLVSQYLNSQDWYTWDIGDGEFNVADNDRNDKNLFWYRKQFSSTVPDHEFDVLYINDYLVAKIVKLFGMEINTAIESIINWFNQEYDTELTIKDFEWMETDDEEYDDEEYEN